MRSRRAASPPAAAPVGTTVSVCRSCGRLLGTEPQTMVVNIGNRTPAGGPAVPELPLDDVVEVTALVGKDGVAPIPQPPLPVAAGQLLRQVKEAEREFVRAALAGDPGIAAEALREHPAGGADAARIFGQLRTVAEER